VHHYIVGIISKLVLYKLFYLYDDYVLVFIHYRISHPMGKGRKIHSHCQDMWRPRSTAL